MRLAMLGALALVLAAAAVADDKKGTSKKEVKESDNTRVVHTPPPPNLPKGAVEIGNGLWRWVDKDDKVWHYRRTPFGLAKYEPEESADSGPADSSGIVARDKGETVEFEAKSPFGVRKWTRNKGELDAQERAALKRAEAAKAAAGPESKSAASKSTEAKAKE